MRHAGLLLRRPHHPGCPRVAFYLLSERPPHEPIGGPVPRGSWWDDSNPARNGIYALSSSDGSNLTRLTTNPLGGNDEPGAYSPNGKRIVFLRTVQNGDGVGLFVVNTNGTDLQRSPTRHADPEWRRRRLVAAGQQHHVLPPRHANVRGSIWVIHADGCGLHEINVQAVACGGSVFDPSGFGCHEPHWSRDGKKIIFAGNSPTTGVNIYTVSADGSNLFQVPYDGGDDEPAWGITRRDTARTQEASVEPDHPVDGDNATALALYQSTPLLLSEQFDVSAVWASGRSPDIWLRVATMATLEVRSSSPRCSLASCFRSTIRSSRT